MSDGEVKIHVSADADLKQIETAQQRIKDLHRAADAYESKGMDTAAKSARGDARSIERDVSRWTKERASEERVITREQKAQEAMRKAGINTAGRRASQAVGVGEQMLAGGNPASSASSMLLSMAVKSGNPLAIGAAAVAAIAATIVGVRSSEAHEDEVRKLKFEERKANDRFDLKRASGVFGSSGELVGKSLSAEKEISEREAAKAGMAKKAEFRWLAPSTWEWGGLRKNEAHKEQEENDNAIRAAKIAKDSADDHAKERFTKGEGGMELDALRQRGNRTMAGSRAAFADDEALKAFAKYNEAKRQGASDDQAKEMGTLTYQNDLREKQAHAGAGLVDARSGGAGIAAAARWATQATPGEKDIGGKFDALINVVTQGNQENHIVKHSK